MNLAARLSHAPRLAGLLFAGLVVPFLHAQERSLDSPQVREALSALADQRAEIAEEKIPLAQQLGQLQERVRELRTEASRTARLGDSASLNLNALGAEVKARQDEVDYISNLLVEYLRALESRLHPAELPSRLDELAAAFRAVDDATLTQSEKWERLLTGLQSGVTHVDMNIGGAVLDGEVVLDNRVIGGDIVLYGPLAYFSGNDLGGLVLKGQTDIPQLFPIEGSASQLATLASEQKGLLPADPTLGRAVAIAETRETLFEHIQKGGIWIYPILGFALVALIISTFKFFEISGMKVGKGVSVRPIIADLRAGRVEEAKAKAKELPDSARDLILTGIEGVNEPKEILEEMLIEKIAETQPKLERLLPIVQVTAATAPLLGLLGTVTGMINTFKLITIFGTGDAKQLSGGISEALITTEFGLIVAIPSLIAFAILNRYAKSTLANLEKLAMSFVNGVCASRDDRSNAA
ncbi:MAG: MotA/TolQ/ExbB proton channel family protein [Opitutales bacterium]